MQFFLVSILVFAAVPLCLVIVCSQSLLGWAIFHNYGVSWVTSFSVFTTGGLKATVI